jgi:hypothetical protein
MTQDYLKTWEAMNSLESVSSKICSAREILDSAIESLESGNRKKTETLLYAVDEFLQYYLKEFDELFKVAWNETVVKLKEEDPCMRPWGHSDLEYALANPILTHDRNSNFPGENTICDKDDLSPECQGAWNDFWEEHYYPEEVNSEEKHSESYYDYTRNDSNRSNPFDKVIRWRLPVEEVENGDTGEQEYFIAFPDDLLEASNLKEGDVVEWVDRNDGTFILRKITKPFGMDEC